MGEFITLTCPSCGGKLQITPDINRFACAFCGIEHLVRRTPSLVSLVPADLALNNIQSNTDRTASELAIRRLESELEELSSRISDADFAIFHQSENTGSPFAGMVASPQLYVSGGSKALEAWNANSDTSTRAQIKRQMMTLAWREEVFPKMEEQVAKFQDNFVRTLLGGPTKAQMKEKLTRCRQELTKMRQLMDRVQVVLREIERHQMVLND